MLKSLSPLDNRYSSKTQQITEIFSEFSFCKFRLQVEISWFCYILNHQYKEKAQKINHSSWDLLNEIKNQFDNKEFLLFKEIEKKTKHDAKAIEYYLKKKIEKSELAEYQELIHFGLTSDDINHTAYALMLKNYWEKIFLPTFAKLIHKITTLSENWKKNPMLSRTHGQPASSTTVGKEFYNFSYRLYKKFSQAKTQNFIGKLNGSTGNYQALTTAFPNSPWQSLNKEFLVSLGLKQNIATTQIEPHDFMVEIFQQIQHTHSILIGFCQDIWYYISLDYFIIQQPSEQIGSSIMPHKINPIDFENAEGNFGLSNGSLEFFIRKLPISRMQRDLSDSTVLRNIGVALGHSHLGMLSVLQGLKKLSINSKKLEEELLGHWEILGEAVQTMLRKYFVKDSYEKIKKKIHSLKNENDYKKWIESFDLSKEDNFTMLNLNPASYTGLASCFDTDFIFKEIEKYVH